VLEKSSLIQIEHRSRGFVSSAARLRGTNTEQGKSTSLNLAQ